MANQTLDKYVFLFQISQIYFVALFSGRFVEVIKIKYLFACQ